MKEEKNLKKHSNKVAISIAVVLLLAGGGLYAAKEGGWLPDSPAIAHATSAPEKQCEQQVAFRAGNPEAVAKNETVYVKLQPDGQVKDTTVVNWLHFSGQVPSDFDDPIKLDRPQALNGPFKVRAGSEGIYLSGIETDAKNVFYSGHTAQPLPVEVQIRYYLNGQPIEAAKLHGKSGEVKMEVQVHNRTGRNAVLAGNGDYASQKTLYTPFVTMVSLDLPVEKFSEVDPGEGSITVLGETMKASWLLFPYPDATATLTMKAENFSLTGVSLMAQPQMPPLPEVTGAEKLMEMDKGLEEMDHALAQVEQGSQELVGGQSRLQAGLGTIKNGLNKLVALHQGQEKVLQGVLGIHNLIIESVKPLAENPMLAERAKPLLAALEQEQQLLSALANGGRVQDHDLPPLSAGQAGLEQAAGGIDQLSQGVQASQEGAQKLQNGVASIRSQGVAPMRAGVQASIQELNAGQAQITWMEQAVKDYTSFLGKPKGVKSQVQFVMQTEEI